ncbi:MAG TPA: helix-turn-helix domain-containing protein [Gemmatimonadales bacterium]|nr:helix-turn-helix domain-containing protein [Gemmatimonadales bacterium]
MYERVAPGAGGGELDALWHLDEGRTFFAGPLDYNASHQHGAPVYLAGLYGSFGLRVEGGRWLSVRTAVIPAGVRHELHLGGQPIGVFYIEPDLAGADALMPLVRDTSEDGGALVGRTGEVGALRALYEARDATRWAGAALSDLLGFSRRRARREMDPRIARVVAGMSGSAVGPGCAPVEVVPVVRLAAEAGLSASRFQHLFTREVGVPFRRYRAWQRMRGAIAEIVRGRTFTEAVHAAGFSDQAHFGHDFRRTFGAAATRSLTTIRF